jgi:Tol biopolymer transport system component
MGEVYRARDTALHREVALKVLPGVFAQDADRLARFAREAQALASLNHPNIAQIYGLEQTGSTPALVLELVEGPTLADVIQARGPGSPIALTDALAIARQIADALEAAHNAGIVHRDLKPANVKLRVPATAVQTPLAQLDLSETTVKVLDFGLAKALSADPASGASEPSNSPTLTNRATALGVILGTAAYMAPEQARGKSVDRRADVWAFGVVLLEMLTGRRVFRGEEVTDVLAQVITAEPDWKALPPATPPAVRRLLRRCLEKDPRRRLRDIGDARIELDHEDAAETVQASADAALPLEGPPPKRRLAWLGWAVAAALAAALGVVTVTRPGAQPPPLTEFTLDGFGALPLSSDFAVSPDGTMLAMVTGAAQQRPAIWIRPLGELEARAIPGTEGAVDLFWSADSQSIGFLADGYIRHVKVATGVAAVACQTDTFRGGTWSHDNTIVFSARTEGLRRCDSSTPITTVASPEVEHAWPVFLPDGRHIVYLAVAPGSTELRVVSLDGTATTTIGPADSNAVFAAGHLIYTLGDRLVAQAFDASALRTTGDPFPLADGLPGSVSGRRKGLFSASSGGVLVYRLLNDRIPDQLTWIDRHGRPIGKVGEPGVFVNLNLSPTGRQLAVSRLTGSPPNVDIWLIDFERANQFTRLTDHAGAEHDPAWSPDGRTLIFNSNRQGAYALFQKPADPGAAEENLVSGGSTGWMTTPEWSGPAKAIFYSLQSSPPSRDIWLLPVEGERKPRAFLATRFDERDPAPSPDGRFVAYESDASGRREIYVRPYPAGEPAVPVSVAGGVAPRWRGDGREIVFVSLDGMMMGAAIDTSAGVRVAPPRELFPVTLGTTDGHPYAVSSDGQRFVIPVRETSARPAPLTVTTDFVAGAVR